MTTIFRFDFFFLIGVSESQITESESFVLPFNVIKAISSIAYLLSKHCMLAIVVSTKYTLMNKVCTLCSKTENLLGKTNTSY